MIPLATGLFGTTVPVDPDGPEARDWLIGELAKPEYAAAKPTWFDLASKAVGDWFNSLFSTGSGSFGTILLVVVVVIVVGLIAVAFVTFGVPRLNRRSRERAKGLFGAHDLRDAATLRAAAEQAARAGDWTLAVEERFRAIAQGLDERTIVMLTPGTTANDFAARAGAAIPDERSRLTEAARSFDSVRYLGRPGSPQQYDDLVALDLALQRLTPGPLSGLADELVAR